MNLEYLSALMHSQLDLNTQRACSGGDDGFYTKFLRDMDAEPFQFYNNLLSLAWTFTNYRHRERPSHHCQ